MILDIKDLICLIVLVAGLIVKRYAGDYAYIGKAMIIASIIDFIAVHVNRIYITIKEIINPRKMPPPK